MSEPAAKPRYLGEARNAFDLEEIERRMRESIDSHKPAPEPDPLAELARLVGQTNNDAFGRIFDVQGGPTAPPPGRGLRPVPPAPVGAPSREQLYADAYEPHPEPYQDGRQAYAPDPAYGEEHAQPHAQHGYEQPQDMHAQAHAYGDQQSGYAAEGYAPQDGSWQDHGYQQDGYYQEQHYEEPPRSAWRARLLIGAAALVVAAGGAGAYMLRGHSATGGGAPTIMANTGPTKVQPAEQASDGPKPSISILERGAPGASQQSKIVQNEEQPVDVAATARVSGSRPARTADAGAPVTLAPPNPPPVANSIFAEPKRVKAIAVRPDGSVIDQNAPVQRAEATPSPSLPMPGARPNDMASLVASTTPSSTPGAAPRTPTRAADPRPAVEAKPVAAVKPPVRPAATVSAPSSTASIPAPTGAGGAFSVQLAGTTSVEEARDAVERLTRRYASELGGHRPAVVKAEVGSKTVYRVRVKGLSSEDANTLCARLKSSGGSCFVARN